VLITGGAGFIGHNTALFLRDRGVDVTVFDNLKRATNFSLKRLRIHGVELISGDVLDTEVLHRAVKGVDVVVHAAAYISAVESIRKPALYFVNNVAGTAAVAAASLRGGVGLLVYLSSAAVYGNPAVLPISESHPTRPVSPYGLTKLMGEDAIKFYAGKGLDYVILRLFNVYGPVQSGAYAGVITRFMENVCRGKPPIIHGHGEQTRDFIHVYDVARSVWLCMERGVRNETINIGSGKPTTIRELAELIIRLADLGLEPIFVKARPGDIRHSHADIRRAEKLLGFKPEISLEKGLKELLGYLRAKYAS